MHALGGGGGTPSSQQRQSSHYGSCSAIFPKDYSKVESFHCQVFSHMGENQWPYSCTIGTSSMGRSSILLRLRRRLSFRVNTATHPTICSLHSVIFSPDGGIRGTVFFIVGPKTFFMPLYISRRFPVYIMLYPFTKFLPVVVRGRSCILQELCI